MGKTLFSRTPRRFDPLAALTVQKNLEELADKFDKGLTATPSGGDTMLAGESFIVVTHNLGYTNYEVFVAPRTNQAVNFWISNKNADDFRLNISSAAGGSGFSFDWMVKGAV